MEPDRNSALMQSVANRLKNERGFMASVFTAYMTQFGVSDEQLAASLGCGMGGLTVMGICRAARTTDNDVFLRDVKAIAQMGECDWQELARVARSVQAVLIFQSFDSDEQMLKAARDHHDARSKDKDKD